MWFVCTTSFIKVNDVCTAHVWSALTFTLLTCCVTRSPGATGSSAARQRRGQIEPSDEESISVMEERRAGQTLPEHWSVIIRLLKKQPGGGQYIQEARIKVFREARRERVKVVMNIKQESREMKPIKTVKYERSDQIYDVMYTKSVFFCLIWCCFALSHTFSQLTWECWYSICRLCNLVV